MGGGGVKIRPKGGKVGVRWLQMGRGGGGSNIRDGVNADCTTKKK